MRNVFAGLTINWTSTNHVCIIMTAAAFHAQVMLGVDRLDMIKGIPQKLLAFEEFLEEHPEWRDKVLLVQIAVPSRTDVPEYQVSWLSPNSDLTHGLLKVLLVQIAIYMRKDGLR